MNCFQQLTSEIKKINDLRTERSFYPKLEEFFKKFVAEELKIMNEISVISEASSKVHETRVGFPDLTIQRKLNDFQTVGWVEVKLPEDNLSDEKFQKQFDKYKDSLENILFTNLREWRLYQWDDKGKAKKISECLFDVFDENTQTESITKLLEQFFEGKALELKTPKQLALALARKTRLLSQQVQDNLEESLENEDTENDLVKLKSAFSSNLIKDIKPHQFANMAAETIAYSFFLAALEHQKRGENQPLTFTTAIDYLPQSVPILSDLYGLIGGAAKRYESIKFTIDSLIEQFAKADMEKIYNKLAQHEIGQDPVIHFYEPFLAEYDPKEREARGVYYTPKPVVDYIVKSVDIILREKFGKIAGIEERDVYLLDPATGTGTFLMSAIEMIYQNKKRQFGALGDDIVRKEFIRVTQNHILKHFFGFELMIAPYAIAHLKLTMLVEEFGFDFEMTKNNDDPDDDRFKIFLANTLDEPEGQLEDGQLTLFSFHKSISEESRKASEVKSDKPIMAIIGNPPYSGHSSNNGEWIRKLVNDYYFVDGKPLNERNPKWLQDDYVKFIRFAQWKIEQTGEGVVGFITNHGYLDNPTFRGMRKELMNHFNEIYVMDLHGNSLKKEITPEGGKDENVFNIQTGVSIAFLIKKQGVEGCKVFRSDLYGLKNDKNEFLKFNTIKTTDWQELNPMGEFYLFKKQDNKIYQEYQQFTKINEIFTMNSVGIVTARDNFVIDFEKDSLKKKIDLLVKEDIPNQYLIEKFNLKEKANWKLNSVRDNLVKENNLDVYYKTISYRPFDNRIIFYHKSLIERDRHEIMGNMFYDNFALITSRQAQNGFRHSFVTNNCIEFNLTGTAGKYGSGYLFSLFFYTQDNINITKNSNFNEKYIKLIESDISTNFNQKNTINIFDYIYGILYLPKYREKYSKQLKMDFPRIPLPSQAIKAGLLPKFIIDPKEAFETVSKLGEKLRNLHLLTASIFEDQNLWDVKIGGKKPEGLDDWKVTQVKYNPEEKKVYVNQGQYFDGIEPEVWNYHIGGYQVLDKWLKDRKKAERCLSLDDLLHYMKIVVSIRETIKAVKGFESS